MSTPEKYVLVKRLIMLTGNSITIATGHPNCVTKHHMINKTSFTQYHCPVIQHKTLFEAEKSKRYEVDKNESS